MDITRPEELLAAHKSVQNPQRVDVEALVAGAAQALRTQSVHDAAAMLRGALLVSPEHPEAWALYGETLVALGQDAEARRALETAVSLDDGDRLTTLALLELYARVGARDEGRALATWLRSQTIAPELAARFEAVAKKLEVLS